MKPGLLFLLYFFTAAGTRAQDITQTIRGTITEKVTGAPIPGAAVKILTLSPVRTATANAQGEFRLEQVPLGRHTISIEAIGFNAAVKTNIVLTSAREMILNTELEETVIETEEVVITGEKGKENANNDMATVSARQFSFEESARYAGNVNDVARMAQSFAGVGGSDDSRNDIIVRGNSPTGVLYRLDGVDIPNPNHFAIAGTTGGPVSMLNNNVMANSDFMSSAFAAEYGNALSAVFDLKLRNGNNQQREFVGQIGFNGAELLAEGPISKKSKSSYLVTYRYSTLDVFKKLGIEFGTTAVPKYQDLSFKLNFPHKKGALSLFGMGGLSHVDLLNKDIDTANNLFAEQGEDLYFTSRVGMAGISHNWLISSTSMLRVTVAAHVQTTGIINDTISPADALPKPYYRNNSYQGKTSLILLYNKKFSARHLLRIGGYIDQQFFSLSDSVYRQPLGRFVNLSDFNGTAWMLQPYTQWQWRPTNAITLNAGVHALYYTVNKAVSLEPRAGVKFAFGKHNSISLGYGLHSQLPPAEIYFKLLRLPDDTQVRANRNLGFSKAHHVVLGYDKIMGENVRLKTEVYYQFLFNVPVDVQHNSFSLLNQGANYGFALPDSLQNTGTGYNYGAEVTFEKFFSRGYYYLVTLSVYNSQYTGNDGVTRNTAFNGHYLLNLLGGKEFSLGKKDADGKRSMKNVLTLDLRTTVNGGQWYTPVNVPASRLTGQEILDEGQAYTLQYPAYFRIDFKIGFKLNGKKTTHQWSVDLRNLSNQQNVFIRRYDAATNTYRTSYQTGFLPVAQYRIEF